MECVTTALPTGSIQFNATPQQSIAPCSLRQIVRAAAELWSHYSSLCRIGLILDDTSSAYQKIYLIET